MSALIEHETERLRLLACDERHLAPFVAMNADPQLMRDFPAPQSAAQSRARVLAWRAQSAEQGWGNWAVELKSSGRLIDASGLAAGQLGTCAQMRT